VLYHARRIFILVVKLAGEFGGNTHDGTLGNKNMLEIGLISTRVKEMQGRANTLRGYL